MAARDAAIRNQASGGERVLFLRLHDIDPADRGAVAASIVKGMRQGGEHELAFQTRSEVFGLVPGSPFSYWVPESIRQLFGNLPEFENSERHATKGLATTNDDRFLRLWWEANPVGRNGRNGAFVPFAKGGNFGRYFADIPLVIQWAQDGRELKAYLDHKIGGENQWSRWINSIDFYFLPGITWPLRAHTFSPRALPEGCIFSVRGYVAFVPMEDLPATLGLLATEIFDLLFKTSLGRADYPEFLVGVIQQLPFPPLTGGLRKALAERALRGIELVRSQSRTHETSHAFSTPVLTQALSEGLTANAGMHEEQVDGVRKEIARLQRELDAHGFEAYGVAAEELSTEHQHPLSGAAEGWIEGLGTSRPVVTHVADLLMWALGVAFGRWDIRMAKNESLIPDLQGPFERLPHVAPASLVGLDGLPATPDNIASESWLRARPNVITLPDPGSFDGPDHGAAENYPIDVAWDCVLVDDPDHPDDIVRKVREVLRWVYGPDRAKAIEDEAVEILRGDGRTPRTLRDWFRNQKATDLGKNFFDFHISRYSKSGRKAPIYWRLCTSPGRGQSDYGVWLYYPRLTDETLWTVLRRYVGPKLVKEESRLAELRGRRDGAEDSEAQSLGKEIEEVQDVLEELRWFEGELRKVAESGKYAPDLDDGVVISMAPLHPVVPWKEPEKIWKKLKKGEYDWAKLAMRYWPDRVREKCEEDRSLAIAHGLDTDTESE